MSARRTPRAVAAAWGRKRLWRTAFAAAAQGVRVTGRVPRGGAVVVANHSSHADIAALIAALPASSAPVVAAAADHWFATPFRAAVCTTLTGGRPVRRDGGGLEDLLGLADHLRAGRVVVVFPEGTRARDGQLADFRSGAFRLAAAAGVPVVPAAILGSADVLPVEGGHLPRSAPCEVRFGDPVDARGTVGQDPRAAVAAVRGRAQSAVVRLLDQGPARSSQAQSHARVAGVVEGRSGLVLAGGWGTAEALSWPLMAELFLMGTVPASPRRWWRLGASVSAGSVVGVVAHAALARRGVVLPTPLTTPRMSEAATAHLRREGGRAMFRQLVDGVPVKVYAARAGDSTDLSLVRLAAWTALARSTRILGIGAALALVSTPLQRVLRPAYGVYWPCLLLAFAGILRSIVRSWR